MCNNHVSLYIKYRPKLFTDVIGKEYIVKKLSDGVISNTLHHAYIFSGPAGVGKTTLTKILGYAVNCSNIDEYGNPCYSCSACMNNTNGFGDIREIDGATNRGIDNIKSLKEDLNWTAHSKKIVVIIDESHMLTEQAWNALLKIIEEPPTHVMFIFASTEIDKIPKTIRSRCQTLHFHPIDKKLIASRLKFICDNENITYESNKCFDLISEFCFGGMRDSITLLEECLDVKKDKDGFLRFLSIENIGKSMFSSNNRLYTNLYFTILKGNTCEIGILFNELNFDIKPESFDILIKLFRKDITTKKIPTNIVSLMIQSLEILVEFKNKLNYNCTPKILLELACLKCCVLFKDTQSDLIKNNNLK